MTDSTAALSADEFASLTEIGKGKATFRRRTASAWSTWVI
jgi:hypothetical protein